MINEIQNTDVALWMDRMQVTGAQIAAWTVIHTRQTIVHVRETITNVSMLRHMINARDIPYIVPYVPQLVWEGASRAINPYKKEILMTTGVFACALYFLNN